MKAILANLVLLTSVAFAAFLVFVWCRSYVLADNLQGSVVSYNVEVELKTGTAIVTLQSQKPDRGFVGGVREASWKHRSRPYKSHPVRKFSPHFKFQFAGFGYRLLPTHTVGNVQQPAFRTVAFPVWALMLVTMLPLTMRLRAPLRRRSRRRQGLCLNCGYDLRGGLRTCPECGKASSSPPADDSSPRKQGQSSEADVDGRPVLH